MARKWAETRCQLKKPNTLCCVDRVVFDCDFVLQQGCQINITTAKDKNNPNKVTLMR